MFGNLMNQIFYLEMDLFQGSSCRDCMGMLVQPIPSCGRYEQIPQIAFQHGTLPERCSHDDYPERDN